MGGRGPPGVRRRGAGHAPARRGAHPARPRRPRAQARPRRAARRRVRRPAAAARARPRRHLAAGRRDRPGAHRPVGRRVRRPGGRRHADRLVPVPAHGRAPPAAATAAAHPPAAHRRAAAALARPVLGYKPDHRGDAVAVLRAELALHTREVRRLHEKLFYRPLLSAVARVPGERLQLGSKAAGDWLRALGFARPGRRAAPPRVADRRRVPDGGHAEGAAAGAAADLRRLPQPRRRSAGLPAGQRGARRQPVVPAPAARRGAGHRAAGLSCWARASTSPRCSPAPRRRCASSPTTPSSSRARPTPWPRRGGRPRPGRRIRRTPSAPSCAGCAGTSCCASPAPTCSAGSTSSASDGRSPTSPSPRCRSALDVAERAHAQETGVDELPMRPGRHRHGAPRRGRDGLRLRRRRDVRAPSGRGGRRGGARPPRPTPSRTRCAGCSPSRRPDPAFDVDADLRPEGRQGALVRSARVLPRVLRALGVGLGGPGAAARGTGRRGRRAGGGLRGADRPHPLPRRRTVVRAGGRDPADQGPGRAGAAAPRGRPGDAHEAGSRWPRRRRVDRPAAPALCTAPARPSCGSPRRPRR